MKTNYNFQELWKQKESNKPDTQSIIKKLILIKKTASC
jgi:hypothetical protein